MGALVDGVVLPIPSTSSISMVRPAIARRALGRLRCTCAALLTPDLTCEAFGRVPARLVSCLQVTIFIEYLPMLERLEEEKHPEHFGESKTAQQLTDCYALEGGALERLVVCATMHRTCAISPTRSKNAVNPFTVFEVLGDFTHQTRKHDM